MAVPAPKQPFIAADRPPAHRQRKQHHGPPQNNMVGFMQMTHIARFRLFFSLGLMLPSLCLAQTSETGNELLHSCTVAIRFIDENKSDPIDTISLPRCLSYVGGSLDALALSPLVANGNQLICLPPQGLTPIQVVRIVVKYLRERPEILHQRAVLHVAAALLNSFPCK